jgi:hypothetical protein
MFLHRNEDKNGREHWLLFRHPGNDLRCFDPLATHQDIHKLEMIDDMYVVAAYFLGQEVSCRICFLAVALSSLQVSDVKTAGKNAFIFLYYFTHPLPPEFRAQHHHAHHPGRGLSHPLLLYRARYLFREWKSRCNC